MDNFAYDVPYPYIVDFSREVHEDEKHAEAFFEQEHANHDGPQLDVTKCINDSDKNLEQDFYTPLKVTPEASNTRKCLRKSISMTNIPIHVAVDLDEVNVISTAMEQLQMPVDKKQRRTITTKQEYRKSHNMMTRADTPKLTLRTRSISRDYLDKLAQPKRKHISHEDLQTTKYMTMAEEVNQFHRKTPQRFHTKSKADPSVMVKGCGPIPNTIPQSPALATKQRARPTHLLTREEQELLDYEELKKFKIKANPVNAKILQGPVQLPCIAKKALTRLSPFKLTEVPVKKAPVSPKRLLEFHAKPIPKSVFEPPKPIIKSHLITNPQTPKMMKRNTRVELSNNQTILEQSRAGQPFKLEPTKVMPFSFEQRDRHNLNKREKLLSEVLEEEQKKRIFQARPVPKNIFKSPETKSSNDTIYRKRQKSDTSIFTSTESVSEPSIFKAQPAKVLYMKPFEPKKDDTHLIEISEFQLNSIRRAKEREEFEQKRKEKEEKIAQVIKEHSEQMLKHEEEEAAKLRKGMEHKAQPIRRYKEMQPVAAKKLTSPVSPRFLSDKVRNKENVNN